MKRLFILCILLGGLKPCFSQINGYAKVTARSGNTLTVSNVNESYGTFVAGQKVIVMQMQDDVIGTTTNSSNFGSLGSITSAGLYEVAQIASVIRSGGNLVSVTLTTGLSFTYHFGSNESVQLITYPVLGNPDYSTTTEIKAVAWNGNTGGVVAFRVNGTLTLNHNVHANFAGFRGADTDDGDTDDCGEATSYRTALNERYGNKGEGIFKVSSGSHVAGRAKIINGGGGGAAHNAGGGGGGNYSAGGEGGPGWQCNPGYGGQGGLSLRTVINSNRIFMGGGGGAGEVNNGNNSAGGNGGGIVIIQATTVRTTGSGAAIEITANGNNSGGVSNDGAGGAGAGGSILFNVANWNVSPSKPIIVTANGGSGGDVGDAAQHGGGGGGGQGVIFNTQSWFGAGVEASTQNGLGGFNSAGGTRAQGGAGVDNAGVFGLVVLPVKITYFTGTAEKEAVRLNWQTAEEKEIDYYEVQRSSGNGNFERIGIVAANNYDRSAYQFTDRQPLAQPVVTYRLKITSYNGGFNYSKTIVIRNKATTETGIYAFPNPAVNSTSLFVQTTEEGMATVQVMSMQGLVMTTKQYRVMQGNNTLSLPLPETIKPGMYAVRVLINNKSHITHLVIQK